MRGFAAKRIATCDPTLGVVTDGAIVMHQEHLVYVGPRSDAPADVALEDVGDRLITPGLIDAHTHACWTGSRHAEYAIRMAGGDYRAIAAAGGGIVATHLAVAAATEDELADELTRRLRRMAALGVTTVEVKSGYGLLPEHELKQLVSIARAAAEGQVPDVVPTLLALHALPPGANREAFVAAVANELVPRVARDGLARYVDAYVDANAFTVGEARLVGGAALAAGLGVRFHVGQFADVGGAELAAELGAASVDHLEHVAPTAVQALARAGVSAVLLPVASFTLAQSPPPVRALLQAGVPLVVASDSNPGTAPTESLPLAMALAVRSYGLTPEQALLGATLHAASALGLSDRGALRQGARADLVIWDLPHEHALVQPWGTSKAHAVIARGREIDA